MAKTPVITTAPAVEEIAKRLIRDVHTDLKEARIVYLFTDKERVNKGKVVAASIQKLDPVRRYLTSDGEGVGAGAHYLMLVDLHRWFSLKPDQWVALVDHELCHAVVDEDLNFGLTGHDGEEFRGVLERRGFWQEDLKDFGRVAQQLPLEGMRAAATAPETASASARQACRIQWPLRQHSGG